MDKKLIYYNKYIRFIKTLKNKISFDWVTPSKLVLIENYKKTKWEDYDNVYLQNTKNNKIELAKDILKNGMNFPIFIKKVNNINYVILGSHRVMSLHLYESLYGKIDINFLCVILPEELFIDNTFSTYKNSFITIIRRLSKKANNELYNNNIKPFEGFNSYEYFKNWMEK